MSNTTLSDPKSASNRKPFSIHDKSKSSSSFSKSAQQCPSQYNPTLRNSDINPTSTNTREASSQQHYLSNNKSMAFFHEERYSSNVTEEESVVQEDEAPTDINEFECLLEKYKPHQVSLSFNEEFQFPKEFVFAAIGGKQVGKSSIISHSSRDEFPEETNLSLEESHVLNLSNSSQRYAITILDSCRQNGSNEALQQNVTIGVEGYALIFDITSEKSFQVMKELHRKLLDVLMATITYGTLEIPRVLIGNMKDKIDDREVRREDAVEYAANWGIPYFEISAMEKSQCISVWTVLLAQVEENEEIRCDPERSHEILMAQQEAVKKRKEKTYSKHILKETEYKAGEQNLSHELSKLSFTDLDEESSKCSMK